MRWKALVRSFSTHVSSPQTELWSPRYDRLELRWVLTTYDYLKSLSIRDQRNTVRPANYHRPIFREVWPGFRDIFHGIIRR